MRFLRFVRRYWWTFLVGAAVVGGVFVAIFTPRRCLHRGDPGFDVHAFSKPTFREQAEREVNVIRLEGEVERARVTARADTQREQIDAIEAVGKNDPAEGRRQMARFLRDNL